jgi:hypothetical protein
METKKKKWMEVTELKDATTKIKKFIELFF